MRSLDSSHDFRNSTTVLLALAAAMVAGLLGALAGLGHRWGWWDFRTGFQILRSGAYIGIGGFILGIAGIATVFIRKRSRGAALAVIAILISFATIAVPLQQLRIARSVPPIHDITTDLTNPPGFEAILPLRRDAPNPAEYGGPEIADQQRAAYPDVQPLLIEKEHSAVFQTALALVRQRGWKIVAQDPDHGRIEAVATTFWFAFKDDVVIRLTPQDGATRVDMRSVSRVGRSDVGANARRIREFLRALMTRTSTG